jgi:hypothetical protein
MLTLLFDQLDENYQLDSRSMVGGTAKERAEDSLETYKDLKPPEGIVYILEVDGDVAGMGAVRKVG